MQTIVCRTVKDSYEAVTIANLFEKYGGEVVSVVYDGSTTFPWSVWARIHSDSINLVDRGFYGKKELADTTV